MGLSYTAIINHNNRTSKGGLYKISIRVTLDRVSKYLGLDERIDPKFWTGKENRWVKDTHPFATDINKIIKDRIDLVEKYVYRQKRCGNTVTLQGIIEFFNKKADPQSFNDYVKEFMKSGLRGRELNTIKKYNTFVKYLDEFNHQLQFNQLDESLFRSFAIWLKEEKEMLGITVYKYFDPFKVIVRAATKDGFFERNPFEYADLQIKATKGERVYLEVEEISALKNVPVPAERPDLEETRKHWLFCFYMGQYYKDLVKLEWPSVKSTELGYVIQTGRFKNQNAYISPIFKFPAAVKILEEQRGKDDKLVFPGTISEQKYNDKLKELAELSGIEKNLMNKTARHSYIQFWESQGLETQHLAKMVGHTKESTTKNYYELSIRDISQRVGRFDFSKIDL